MSYYGEENNHKSEPNEHLVLKTSLLNQMKLGLKKYAADIHDDIATGRRVISDVMDGSDGKSHMP